MLEKHILNLIKKIKVNLKKDEFYVFFYSLFFHLSIFFSVNNKTLFLIFLLFFYIFYIKIKNVKLSLFILYVLFLPFIKGKNIKFTMIPFINFNGIYTPFDYDLLINFADLAIITLAYLIFRNFINNKKEKVTYSILTTNKKLLSFLIFFLLFVVSSIIFSPIKIVTLLASLKLIRIALGFIVTFIILKHKQTEKIILGTIYSSILFQGIWSSLQFFKNSPLGRPIEQMGGIFSSFGYRATEEISFYRSHGTFDHPNTLGVFLAVNTIFVIVQSIKNKNNHHKKIATKIVVIFGLAGLIFSGSRASWASVLIMLGILFIVNKKEFITKFKKNLLTIFFLIPMIPIIIFPRIAHLLKTFSSGGGFSYREYLTSKALTLIKLYPLGIGYTSFPLILYEKFNFSSFPAPVHNLFLEIAVETGIISLVFFILFLLENFKINHLELHKLKKNTFQFSLKYASFFTTLTFLFCSMFYPFFWSSNIFEYLWFYLAIMIY